MNQSKSNLIQSQFGDVMREKLLSELANSKVVTLDCAVDLNQLRDIRRALRRKYASRSNINRIFA